MKKVSNKIFSTFKSEEMPKKAMNAVLGGLRPGGDERGGGDTWGDTLKGCCTVIDSGRVKSNGGIERDP